jgi:hypothetical protein
MGNPCERVALGLWAGYGDVKLRAPLFTLLAIICLVGTALHLVAIISHLIATRGVNGVPARLCVKLGKASKLS